MTEEKDVKVECEVKQLGKKEEKNVEIISDGTPDGTTVKVNGQKLGLVQSVHIKLSMEHEFATVQLVVVKPDVKLVGKANVVTEDRCGSELVRKE